MTPAELKRIRLDRLGMSARELANALELLGKWDDRTIRRYETPGEKVPGPVAVAVRLLVEKKEKGK